MTLPTKLDLGCFNIMCMYIQYGMDVFLERRSWLLSRLEGTSFREKIGATSQENSHVDFFEKTGLRTGKKKDQDMGLKYFASAVASIRPLHN